MPTRLHFGLRDFAPAALLCAVFAVVTATPAFAQEEKERSSSAIADVIKGVVFDPTTYAPAAISYDATMRDWNTSQVFFRNGYFEGNSRFTMSGRSVDMPISYGSGHQIIVKDTLTTLGVSAAQNLTSRIVERSLLSRYPEHPRLIKTIGWVQRIALSAVMTYRLSAPHYQQAAINAQRARELGLR
jgi:hypothetical protein